MVLLDFAWHGSILKIAHDYDGLQVVSCSLDYKHVSQIRGWNFSVQYYTNATCILQFHTSLENTEFMLFCVSIISFCPTETNLDWRNDSCRYFATALALFAFAFDFIMYTMHGSIYSYVNWNTYWICTTHMLMHQWHGTFTGNLRNTCSLECN